MILIKDIKVLKALLAKEYHPLLIEIVLDVYSVASEIVITEGWREGKGVHSTDPCRGIDLRSWIYSATRLKNIQAYINSRWTYDPKRPTMECCIVHDVGKGIHLHLQVHPNSIKVNRRINNDIIY